LSRSGALQCWSRWRGRRRRSYPYVSGDPEPTPYHQFEIYTFNNGTNTRDGTGGETGVDFNYGAAPDLQLTATLPAGFNQSSAGGTKFGLSNIELAAKYRFLHQDTFGLDVAVFPRVFLPNGSNTIDDNHASLLLLSFFIRPPTPRAPPPHPVSA
jgi:hypothetical protein